MQIRYKGVVIKGYQVKGILSSIFKNKDIDWQPTKLGNVYVFYFHNFASEYW